MPIPSRRAPFLPSSAAAAALAPIWLMAASGAARADRIERINGAPIEGIVIARTESRVTVRIGDAETDIPASNIRRIIQGTDADRKRLEAKTLLGRRAAEGIAALGEAARMGASAEDVAAALMLYSEEIARAIPTLNAEGRAALAEAMRKAASVQMPRQGDFLLARARWSLLLDDMSGARALLAELREADPKTLERSRAEVAEWIGQKVDASMDASRFSEALDLLTELRAIDPSQAGMKRAELVLLWARGERDKGEYEKALQIYVDQLMDASPAIAKERIAVTLEEAERALRSTGELGRAIDLYERFGMVHAAAMSRPRLSALWREEGWRFLKREETAKARQFFARMDALSSGSAAQDFAKCDYLDARRKLRPEESAAHYKLGEWALDRGLLQEAREEFALASRAEPLRASVAEQIRKLDDLEGDRELNRIMDLYEKGHYSETLEGLREFKTRPLPEGYMKQAEQLESLAQEAIKIAAAERPQQAEALWQQAERAYFLGQTAESYDLLKNVMERYPDTPAGGRALDFYRKIRPRLDINEMEKSRRKRAFFPALDQTAADAAAGGGAEALAIAEEIKRLRAGLNPGGSTQP